MEETQRRDDAAAPAEEVAFVCVHCGTPCPSLYRQYTSSASSIKLTSCRKCRRDVDPYVEREWLLVLLDCILLRIEAYRHVLFHHYREIRTRRKQCLLAASLLEAYIAWEAQLDDDMMDGNNEDVQRMVDSSLFGVLYVQAVLGMLALWWGARVTDRLLHRVVLRSGSSSCSIRTNAEKVDFWALCLPAAFHVVTILILVWENSSTVKRLDSVYVLLMQCMGLRVVLCGHDEDVKGSRQASPWWRVLAVLAGGVVLRAGLRFCVAKFWLEHAVSCSGLQYRQQWCLS